LTKFCGICEEIMRVHWLKWKIMQIDDTDRRILRHWLADPGLETGGAGRPRRGDAATCWRRLERLRAGGVIRGVQAVIDWRALGWEVEVSLRFTLDKTNPRAFDEFIAAAREVPEVIEIETFLGRVDVRLNVIARDMGITRRSTAPHPDPAAYRRGGGADACRGDQGRRGLPL
jgi:Lrp/AsnC family transcriptional regulator